MIYLDNAATTPIRAEVLAVLWPLLSAGFGNPSSHHEVGAAAAAALLDARRRVATVLGVRPGEIVFTSGGTEANNLALTGISLGAPRGRHIVTTRIEHAAVLQSCDYLTRLHGFEVSFLDTDATGRVDPEQLREVLRPDTTLVSVQYANNEVGTVQPLGELARITTAARVPQHSDAVQAPGWLPLRVPDLGVNALSLSGHKIGAPQGIGVLMVRGPVPLEPLLHGGGQERGRRCGTQNVAGAVAFATALSLADDEHREAAALTGPLQREFVRLVLQAAPSARLTGHPVHRLPGSASFVFPGTSGEAVLVDLERRGVICSSGSACAAGSDEASHVLLALGIPAEEAQTAVRFTFAAGTTRQQLHAVAERLAATLQDLQDLSRP